MKVGFFDTAVALLLGGAVIQCGVDCAIAQQSPHTLQRPENKAETIDGVTRPLKSGYSWLTKLTIQTASGSTSCGATLISPQWLLTTASCVFPDGETPVSIDALIGSVDLSDSTLGERRQVISYTTYNGSSDSRENNIALLKLDSPSSKSVAYIAGDIRPTTPKYSVINWGPSPQVLDLLPNEQAFESATLIAESACSQLFPGINGQPRTDLVCMGGSQRFSCLANDGGPLLEYGSGIVKIYGVANTGSQACPSSSEVASYTKVSKYRSWIQEVIADTVSPDVRILSPWDLRFPKPDIGIQGSGFTGLGYGCGNILFQADAYDNLGVEQLDLILDGVKLQSFISETGKITLDSYKYTNGIHNFTAEAIDYHGNRKSVTAEAEIRNLPPVFSAQPTDQTVVVGNSVTLRMAVTGTCLSSQWMIKRKGSAVWENIPGGHGSAYTFVTDASHVDARFRVVVYNRLGTITSQDVGLNLLFPVQIATQPLAQGNGLNKAVTFSVGVTGSGPSYKWQFKSAATNSVWTTISGATAATYTVTATTATVGSYRVVVTGLAGNTVTSAEAGLRIILPPKITTQPRGLLVVSGSTATFSITASGEQLMYRWQSKPVVGGVWADISGANSSSLVLQATAASALKYRVTVTNPGGSVTSSEVRLRLR